MSSLVEVEAAAQKAWASRKFRTAVAVDGSVMSDKAMMVASGFNYAARSDKLFVLHVTDATKTYLPKNLEPKHLKNYYEGKAMEYHVHCEWAPKEKDQSISTCANLIKMAEDAAADMLVMGSFGRKGEKIDVLGSTSDESLRTALCSVCIVKQAGGPRPGMVSTILFATDGSKAAALAFIVLLHRLRQPKDKVIVVCVRHNDQIDDDGSDILAPYAAMLADKKVEHETRYVNLNGNETVPEGVLRAVEESEADVVIMGVSGRDGKALGSVASEVVIKSNVTTVIVKDPHVSA